MQSLLYGLFSESPWNSESVQIPYKIINDLFWAKLTCFPLNYVLILRFNVTPCYTSLYLLALATGWGSHQVQDTDACISNNHRLCTHLLPLTITNLHSLQKPERHKRGTKSLSRSFSFTVPGWWNDLPTPIRNADSLTTVKRQLKAHLFRHYLTS